MTKIILGIFVLVFMVISIFFNFFLLSKKSNIEMKETFMFSSLYALGLAILALIFFTIF